MNLDNGSVGAFEILSQFPQLADDDRVAHERVKILEAKDGRLNMLNHSVKGNGRVASRFVNLLALQGSSKGEQTTRY
jgi:hypothetical protein